VTKDKLNEREQASASKCVADVIHAPVAWPEPTETILLVEDMAALRNMTRDFLGLMGYEIITAENGREALEVLQSRSIGLVVTDVTMPEMGGVELVRRGRKLHSDLKVIFSSGHGDVDLDAVGISETNTLVLLKPYSLSTLAMSVRELLGVNQERKSA
jgi:DNA-binding NtrC family response regulator